MENPNKTDILKEIESVNDFTDQKTVESLHNRLMLYNTWNGANKDIFDAAKNKRII